MKKLSKIVLGLTSLMLVVSGNAMAAEQTGTAQVNASILPSCNVTFPENVSVIYNPENEASKIISFTALCTKTTHLEVGLSSGVSGNGSNRLMKFGENSLSYSIKKPGRTPIDWTDIRSSGSYSDTSIGNTFMFSPIFYIPAKQYVATGTYTDQLIVTFSY